MIDLGEKGSNFLINFLSINTGFEYLNSKNWIENELIYWKEKGNVDYVVKVEKSLLNVLDFVKKDYNNGFSFKFPHL